MTIANKGTLGTSVNTANNQASFTHTTATTVLAVGNLGVLIIATENNQTTDGDENCVSNVTDSAGNTWLKAGEFTNGQGTIQAGALVSVWYTVAVNQLNVGGTITGSFTNAAAHDESAFSAWAFTLDGSGVTIPETPTTEPADGADVGSLNVTTANEQRLRIRAISEEANDATQMSATDGTWTLFDAARSAAIANAQCVRGEWKISTGTGDASNPTLAVTTGDSASIYVAFKETLPVVQDGAATFSGSGTLSAQAVKTAAATFAGSGTLSVDATQFGSAVSRAIVTWAQVRFAPAGAVVHQGAVTLNGAGSLAVNATLNEAAAVTLVGTGTLSVDTRHIQVAYATFSGLGTFSARVTGRLMAAANWSGLGTLSVDAFIPSAVSSSTMSGEGSLSVDATVFKFVEVAFAGAGATTIDARAVRHVAALFAGEASLLVQASATLQIAAIFDGTGVLEVLAQRFQPSPISDLRIVHVLEETRAVAVSSEVRVVIVPPPPPPPVASVGSEVREVEPVELP